MKLKNNTKGKRTLITIIAILLTILIIPKTIALGIIPGHQDMQYESGIQKTAKIKIINDGGNTISLFIHAEGPMEQYISFPKSIIEFKQEETEKIIEYTVSLPKNIEKQGITETNIVARTIPQNQNNGDTMIGANIAVVSKLRIIVPYSGKYAETRLIVPPFQENKEASFVIEIKNLGEEDIISGQAIVDIYGPLNNKLASVKSQTTTIRKKEKTIMNVPWIANLPPGSYNAKMTFIYDEKNTQSKAEFSIGRQEISVDDISVNNFNLGGIARFEIITANNWNIPIEEIFADIQVTDLENRIYTQSRTATTTVPANGKSIIEAFWNTELVAIGNYKLKIILNYNSQKTEETFDILVNSNSIKTSVAGNVISSIDNEKEGNNLQKTVLILAGVVLLLVIFNVFIYFRKIKPPSQQPKQQNPEKPYQEIKSSNNQIRQPPSNQQSKQQ